MLVICEILRESDLRFPNKYGSAISILGALVLGEAAVSAGLVSPIMIIITAFTYISSLIFTEVEMGNAIRFYRFIFLIFSDQNEPEKFMTNFNSVVNSNITINIISIKNKK